jgi:hypothetical protein
VSWLSRKIFGDGEGDRVVQEAEEIAKKAAKDRKPKPDEEGEDK